MNLRIKGIFVGLKFGLPLWLLYLIPLIVCYFLIFKGYKDRTLFIALLTINVSVLIITLHLSENKFDDKGKKYFGLVKWFYLSFVLLLFAFLLGTLVSFPETKVSSLSFWLVFIPISVGSALLSHNMFNLGTYLWGCEGEIDQMKNPLRNWKANRKSKKLQS